MKVLEEGGDDRGNVTALEERVVVLDGTATDHEERLTSAEENIQRNYMMHQCLVNIIPLKFLLI